MLKETNNTATVRDIVWTPHPDTSRDRSLGSSARGALHGHIPPQATEKEAIQDIVWTPPGSYTHGTLHKPMKVDGKRPAFQDVISKPRRDAGKDHLQGTVHVHKHMKARRNEPAACQEIVWTPLLDSSKDSSCSYTGGALHQGMETQATKSDAIREIVWAPPPDVNNGYSTGSSAVVAQHEPIQALPTEAEATPDILWAPDPDLIEDPPSGNPTRGALHQPIKALEKEPGVDNAISKLRPNPSKDRLPGSSAQGTLHNQIKAQAIKPAGYHDIAWTRRPDSPGTSGSDAGSRESNAQVNKPAASQDVARARGADASQNHSPGVFSWGTRYEAVKCTAKNAAHFHTIPRMKRHVKRNDNSSASEPLEHSEVLHERRRSTGSLQPDEESVYMGELDSFRHLRQDTIGSDVKEGNSPQIDVDSDDESTYTSLPNGPHDERFAGSVLERANINSYHAQKTDTVVPTTSCNQQTTQRMLSIKSRSRSFEESDDDEYDEDDGFDEFKACIRVDLADPDSFDVMTCAGVPDQVFDETTVIDEEAFQGDLWAASRQSNDSTQPPSTLKSNNYCDLIAPSAECHTFLNPYRNHPWKAPHKVIPPLSSQENSPTSMALKNKEMHSKIDERLRQEEERNDLGALRRDLEELKISTKSKPSTERPL